LWIALSLLFTLNEDFWATRHFFVTDALSLEQSIRHLNTHIHLERKVCMFLQPQSQLSQQSTGTTGAAAGLKAGCLQIDAARKMAVYTQGDISRT
jgi:hypothetical protein